MLNLNQYLQARPHDLFHRVGMISALLTELFFIERKSQNRGLGKGNIRRHLSADKIEVIETLEQKWIEQSVREIPKIRLFQPGCAENLTSHLPNRALAIVMARILGGDFGKNGVTKIVNGIPQYDFDLVMKGSKISSWPLLRKNLADLFTRMAQAESDEAEECSDEYLLQFFLKISLFQDQLQDLALKKKVIEERMKKLEEMMNTTRSEISENESFIDRAKKIGNGIVARAQTMVNAIPVVAKKVSDEVREDFENSFGGGMSGPRTFGMAISFNYEKKEKSIPQPVISQPEPEFVPGPEIQPQPLTENEKMMSDFQQTRQRMFTEISVLDEETGKILEEFKKTDFHQFALGKTRELKNRQNQGNTEEWRILQEAQEKLNRETVEKIHREEAKIIADILKYADCLKETNSSGIKEIFRMLASFNSHENRIKTVQAIAKEKETQGWAARFFYQKREGRNQFLYSHFAYLDAHGDNRHTLDEIRHVMKHYAAKQFYTCKEMEKFVDQYVEDRYKSRAKGTNYK